MEVVVAEFLPGRLAEDVSYSTKQGAVNVSHEPITKTHTGTRGAAPRRGSMELVPPLLACARDQGVEGEGTVRHSRYFDARTNRPDIGAGGGGCRSWVSTVTRRKAGGLGMGKKDKTKRMSRGEWEKESCVPSCMMMVWFRSGR